MNNFELNNFLTEQLLTEKAPPGMESWVKKNKRKFKSKYGKKWQSYLYGTAWKIHGNKNESTEDLEEDMTVTGTGKGTIQTPSSQRHARARRVQEAEELEEEQVHPDDKIGNMMLKKTGTPSYFTSDKKKQTVSQKKVDEDTEEVNEMNVHPEDKIGMMMLKMKGLPNYFETKGDETHQKDVEKVPQPYGKKGYANTKTDAPGNTTGNLPKGYRAMKVDKF